MTSRADKVVEQMKEADCKDLFSFIERQTRTIEDLKKEVQRLNASKAKANNGKRRK